MGIFSKGKEKTSSFIKNKSSQLGHTANRVIGVDEIKNNFNYIKDGYTNMIKDSSKASRIVGKKRDFEEVVKESKITEDQLNSMYRNYALSSYLFIIGTIVCLALIVYSILRLSGSEFILQLLPSVAIGIFCSLFSLRYSLLCYQIKNRDLIKFKDFLTTYNFFPSLKNH